MTFNCSYMANASNFSFFNKWFSISLYLSWLESWLIMREDSRESGVNDCGLFELIICFWSLLTISYSLLICLYFSLMVSCILLHATSFLDIIVDNSSFFWHFCFICSYTFFILSWYSLTYAYNFNFSSSRRSFLPLRWEMVSVIRAFSSIQILVLQTYFGILHYTVLAFSYEL